jgi:50S ribosomal protein L16 3-hydroxylase
LSLPGELSRALGCVLTEPKPTVWFDAGQTSQHAKGASIQLDRRSRMMYDERHVFINGEAFRASGRDATAMAQLADERTLSPAQSRYLSAGAAQLLADWAQAGWLHIKDEMEVK